jgi:peptide/nickel transport system ATP-binding protein
MPLTPIEAAEMTQEIAIEAKNIGVTFTVDGGQIEAVRDVSFTLHKGQTIALVGESGSGKSVTARAIMKLLSKRAKVSPQTEIIYGGRNMARLSDREMRGLRGNRLTMIFQEPMSSLNPVYTIGAQLAEVLRIHQKISKADALKRAVELLAEVQIPDPESRVGQYPHQLSGGQRQRVMIAMALANNPDVLIADEPTTALDVTVQAEILNLIRALQKKMGMAVILITHDLTVVRQFADHVYVMQHGQVREEGPTEQVFTNPQHAYTKRLLSSEPKGRANPLEGMPETVLEGAIFASPTICARAARFAAPCMICRRWMGCPCRLNAAKPLVWLASLARGRPPSGRLCCG